ncbi:MAG: ABC transporter permease [bacterium]|nr:ABC transporter permease [bacterium]
MKFLRLIRVNITRKKTRMALTIGSFAVALFLFGLLTAINNAFYQGIEVAGANRLVVLSKTSMMVFLPSAHKEKIKQIKGVSLATGLVWFGGIYQEEKNFFPQFAIETEHFLQVHPEFKVPDEQWKAFVEDRQGCIVGKTTAERFGWKVGDRIPLRGTIFQGTWEFNICGIYEGKEKETDLSQFWFQYKLLDETIPWMGHRIGWYMVKVENPDDSLAVSAAITDRFANSADEVKAEPEAMFAAGFAKQFGNIKLLLLSVGSVVFFTLLLVAGSTMAMAVRERTRELAVMKTLGFSNILVLVLILGEAVVYSVFGGGLGLLLAKLFTLGGDPTGGLLPLFNLTTVNMITGVFITLIIGVVSGLAPALNGMSLRIVDALRRV